VHFFSDNFVLFWQEFHLNDAITSVIALFKSQESPRLYCGLLAWLWLPHKN